MNGLLRADATRVVAMDGKVNRAPKCDKSTHPKPSKEARNLFGKLKRVRVPELALTIRDHNEPLITHALTITFEYGSF